MEEQIKRPKIAGAPAAPATEKPPAADQVAYCPPHHWRIENSWEQCKKCGERRKLPEREIGRRVDAPDKRRESPAPS